MKKLIYLIFAFIILPLTAEAQAEMIAVRYSTDNGLPSNTVNTTMKDRDGFIWLGTWYGLSSFDGTKFTPYVIRHNAKSDIPPRKVISIVEGKRNILWIRTSDNRFYRFDKTTETFKDMYSELKKVSQNLRVIKVEPIDNGNTLIYTRDKSIYEVSVDNDNNTHIKQIHNSRNDIDRTTMRLKHKVLGETDKYIFWLGNNFGVNILSKNSKLQKNHILRNIRKSEATCFNSKGRNVYIGTAKGEAFAVNCDNGKVQHFNIGSQQTINTITPINNKIFLTTADGIYCGNKLVSTSGIKAETSFADKSGKLWLYGLKDGLVMFDPVSGKAQHFATPQTATRDEVKFCDSGTNGLFILLRNGSVWRYDRRTAQISLFNPTAIAGNTQMSFPATLHNTPNTTIMFYDIDIDSHGLLWLSSANDGLFKIRFPRNQFGFLFQNILANDIHPTENEYGIRSLFQARNGDIWIGTRRQNLYCIDSKTGKLKKKFSDIRSKIYHIMSDRQGNLWLSSKGGGLIKGTADANAPQGIRLTYFRHDDKDRYSISDNNVYYCYQDSKGRIWVCTYGGGLNLMTRRNGKTVFINKNNLLRNYPRNDLYMSTRQILEDGNHTMWIATTDGLLSFDGMFKKPQDIVFNNFRRGNNPTVVDNDIFSILKDRHGNLWLSVFGCGLSKIDHYNAKSGKLSLTTFTDNGLQGNMVSTLVEDRHNSLWFTTENGLASISEEGHNMNSYGYLDGFLPSKIEDNTAICLQDGRVLIGSRQGLIAFTPDEIEHDDTRQLHTFIVDFKVQNRNLGSFDPPISDISPRYAKEITLSHDQNMFSIEFGALKFTGNGNIAFTYILDGYEERWHANDNSHVASYANVPPGTYTFRVKPISGNSPECELRIIILPPWWATWWAYTIYFLILCAAVYGGIRIALTMLKMRNEVYINNRLAELKIRFFTNISHELRTPLTLIKTPISALRRNEKLSAEGKEYLKLIDSNATKMLHLVNQILEFRKVQNGKMPLHLSHTNVADIASVFKDEYGMAAKERNIDLRFILPEEPPMAWCDAEKIGVILNNLISNAFKYTNSGGWIEVKVETRNEGKTCRIAVTDNGAKIPEQQLEKIFERFSMAYNSKSPDTQQTGTGIGLSLAREFAIMHHGRIWAENLPGDGGVTFILEIPTSKEAFSGDNSEILLDDNTASRMETGKLSDIIGDEPEKNICTVAETESGEGTVDNRPVLVLVEDNTDLRRMLQLQLSHQYNVVTAEDGLDGLDKIRAAHPDLIITDLMMPRMDGTELLRRVRKDFNVSHVPVIVLTAKNGDDEKMRTIATGANAFITKPFSMEMLETRIRQLLREQSVFQRKMVLQSQSKHTGNVVSEAQEYEKHLAKKDLEFVDRIHNIIESNLTNADFNIDTIAETVGLSRSAFFKKLKSLTGFAPVDLVREIRMDKAVSLVTTTDMSISEIAYAAGFKESSYFGKCFKKKYGMTPLEYRSQKTKKHEA